MVQYNQVETFEKEFKEVSGMKGKHLELAAGIAIGALLFGGGTAYAAGLLAEPSTQTFYLGDQQIQLEAYAINGHNYVKPRDVGQAVDFNVVYDPARNAAIIEPGKPYTGEDVGTAEPTPTTKPGDSVDYAAQANPAIFTGELTREVYNTIRSTVVDREAILTGSQEPQTMDWSREASKAIDTVTAAMGSYPVYEAITLPGGKLACNVRYPESYAQAAAHTQSFIDGLSSMDQEEQVRAITWYVCDRMTYSSAISSPAKVLTSDSVTAGNCMSYAHSFMFLCDRAGIPCIVLHSETHQWNKVYADGTWWDVDISSMDAGDDTSGRESRAVLHDPSYFQGPIFTNAAPEVTAFVMEVLVPGSTR